jgi:GntR family transcriptional repressor for pyruvate dehydrogenase complex
VELTPIPRSATIADSVFARLVDEILTGRWPANRRAPSERELALALQVNRHTVREALKRLQQVGLLQINPSGMTQVLDWRTRAGLDMLAAIAAAGVSPPKKILADVAVMRRTIGADAARLCALRADDEQLAAVAAAAEAYPESGNLSDLRDADLRLWNAIIGGSNNLAYQLALNTLVRSIDDVGRELFVNLNSVEFIDSTAHRALAAAITARNAEAAERLADELLSQLVNVLQPKDK